MSVSRVNSAAVGSWWWVGEPFSVHNVFGVTPISKVL